ncbi:hypothetical protein ACFOON_03120 [Novosphingobium piscinae]|uniref:Uncharacterized protein n=1 Tax=Novosphingobium piscinae TaxID=1507448 RepID=A0A7X1G1B8_9SPHN|nr:hypothetical protein [Novosphingobium piscinae]MBC2670674.1 hypothetical protein [Novosphingobium piscinae]
MMKPRSLPALTLALALAACSQSQGQEVAPAAGAEAGSASTRVALQDGLSPLDAAPLQPEGAAWAAAGEGLAFAVPGQSPLLTLRCEHARGGVTLIRLVRVTRAEPGAKALVALIGNGRIARLPLNVVEPGETGRWEGVVRALDPRLDVLKGVNRVEVTLPGGGTLMLSASSEPRRLLEACRAADTAPEAASAA